VNVGQPIRSLCEELATTYNVVVLEGCDGVGKTTVADHLAAHHGFQVVHSSRSPDNVDLVQRHRAIITTPGRLALDRSYISELVYGPVLHSGSRLAWSGALELTALAAQQGGVLVHLTAEPRCIHDRLRTRQDGDAWELSLIERIQQQYDLVFAQLDPYISVRRHRTDSTA